MERCDRPDKPKSAPEKVMLEAFLDFHRATLLCKLDGLGDEALRRPGTPSGVTLLGIVKHLTYVERDWIRARFPGEELPPDQIRPADDAEWRIEPDEATAAILAGYRDEHERCRVVVAGAEPDDIARRPGLPGARILAALDPAPPDRGDSPSQRPR